MSTDLQPRIQAMLVERLFLNVEPETIDPAASLVDTYGVDSVSLLELVVGIEETFGIPMADETYDMQNFETVKAITDFVRERLPAADQPS